ncbi:hypothetical protein BSKO_04006 [Bryopsis sp. KO-2023]|nr:hypothetical protein BSKO_04006 [Bryopsis sp. KO-2023]
MENWGVEVESHRPATDSSPAWSAALRAKAFPDADPETLGFATVHELWKRSFVRNRSSPCLGVRNREANGRLGDYTFFSYQAIHLYVSSVSGALLVEFAKTPDVERNVGIYGANCPAWLITFFACSRANARSVPLYDSLGVDAVEYVIFHAALPVVFCSIDKLERLASAVEKRKGVVKVVVYWGGSLPQYDTKIKRLVAAGVRTYVLDDLMEMGEHHRFEAQPPKPDSICTIMYTSGTTGRPKGVMLSHSAFVHNVASLDAFFTNQGISFGHGDSFLSYLPLAHIFDITFEVWMVHIGAKIGYYGGNPKNVLNDAQALKPTMFIGVPRIFDKLCDSVRAGFKSQGRMKKMVRAWGYRRKLAFMKGGIPAAKASPLFNLLFSRRIHAALGGKQRVVISGGAPLSRANEELLRVTMCCPVGQGYGLTETCAAISLAIPDVRSQEGSIGPPLPAASVRLESVPEMNYDALADPPCGELLVKSVHNFTGYYRDEELTESVVTEDGWFHTGDIGTIKNGVITLIDRKKNMFKMSHGEYIAVEIVENKLKKCHVVDQIWVCGDSTKAELVAVVVPNSSELMSWAKQKGLPTEMAQLVKDTQAREYVVSELQKTARSEKMVKIEYVHSVHLETVPFSQENDLLTPTFKPRRRQLAERYARKIEELYAQLG